MSIWKVRFLKKADADFGGKSHQPWPDVAELSSLGCSFSNQDALLPEKGDCCRLGNRFKLWPTWFWPASANCGDAAPNILLEASPAGPGATIQTEGLVHRVEISVGLGKLDRRINGKAAL